MLVNFRDKKKTLETIPPDRLLQIGIPQISFYNFNGQYNALCPFHPDKKLGNFGYNPLKNTWRCFVCGKGGAGVYSLIMAVNNWDFKRTIDFLYEHRNDPVPGMETTPPLGIAPKKKGASKSVLSTRKFVSGSSVSQESAKEDFPYDPHIAPAMLSAIYSAFAKSSPMKDYEIDQLCFKRGLSHNSAAHFFHFPSPFDNSFMDEFRKELNNEDSQYAEDVLYHHLLGVPGFFWDIEKGRVSFVGFGNSIGILNHDIDGRVNGIEMRLREENNGQRYMPFSSESICLRYPDRFTSGTVLHPIVDVVPCYTKNGPFKGIAVTEGKFKALHLSYLGYTALNIRGIVNWRTTLPVLADMIGNRGFDNHVVIAFDADSRSNPPVAENSMNFGMELLSKGYDVEYLTWPTKCGKGIDDVVNHGFRNRLKTVEGQRFIDTTLAPFIERAKLHASRMANTTAKHES